MYFTPCLYDTLTQFLCVHKTKSDCLAAFLYCGTCSLYGTKRILCLIAILVLSCQSACSAASAEADTQIRIVLLHDIAKLHICCHARNYDSLTSGLLYASCYRLALAHAVSDYN